MKRLLLILCLTLSLVWQTSPVKISGQSTAEPRSLNKLEEIRWRQMIAMQERESFKAGLDLLRHHGVPFDPDTLLDERWRRKLAPVFDQMPELDASW